MTITSGSVRMILKKCGFEICKEAINEHIKNSAAQRSRFWFSLKHIKSGIEAECWLRHNLEGHNDNPYNTHRLFIGINRFSKCFDFKGKDNGPSPKEFHDYMKKFSKALDGFAELR